MGETHILVPENNNWLGSIMGVERREAMSQHHGPTIPRVPQIFSGIESNKKCYEPMVVSIGPYYHGEVDDSCHSLISGLFSKNIPKNKINKVGVDRKSMWKFLLFSRVRSHLFCTKNRGK